MTGNLVVDTLKRLNEAGRLPKPPLGSIPEGFQPNRLVGANFDLLNIDNINEEWCNCDQSCEVAHKVNDHHLDLPGYGVPMFPVPGTKTMVDSKLHKQLRRNQMSHDAEKHELMEKRDELHSRIEKLCLEEEIQRLKKDITIQELRLELSSIPTVEE